MSERRPFLQFYPRDWQSDIALRRCSLAARGLWIELMGLMHQAEPYGYLVAGGERYGLSDAARIAPLVGATTASVKRALEELNAKRVFYVADDGTIFSRRMVRDEARRLHAIETGKRGGNPRLTENDTVKGRDKLARTHAIATSEAQNTSASQPSSARAHEEPLDGDELPGVADRADRVRGPAFALARWFVTEAIAAQALPAHTVVADAAYRDVEHARRLLAAHEHDEIEARSRRLFARKRRGAADPIRKACTVATLAELWDWFEAPGACEPPKAAVLNRAIDTTREDPDAW